MGGETLTTRLDRAVALLAEAGCPDALLSARVLLRELLGLDETTLIVKKHGPFPQDAEAAYAEAIRRRAAGEPVALILGRKEFYGREFRVSPATLIPRPETEHLIEAALSTFGEGGLVRFADLGTGSGCLAATFALERTRSLGLALDRSSEALAVARENIRALGAAERVTCLRGDFTRLPVRPGGLDLVLANPPYVSPVEYAACDAGVREYEPRTALVPSGESGEAREHDGPGDGLSDVRALLPEAFRALRPGGLLLCEIGWQQGPSAVTAAEAAGYVGVGLLKDLAGHDRVLTARRAGRSRCDHHTLECV